MSTLRAMQCQEEPSGYPLKRSYTENPTPPTNTVEFLSPIVRRWAETNGAAAAEWVQSVPDGPLREPLLQAAAGTWARTELDAAAEWAVSLPDGRDKDAALQVISTEAARTEPMVALQVAANLPPGAARDAALEHAVSQWTTVASDAAVDWISQISEERLQARLMASAAIARAESDGASAAEMVATRLRPGPEQNRAALAVAQRWVQKEPAAASEWVRNFSDPQVRAAAIETVAAVLRVKEEPTRLESADTLSE